MQLDNTRIAELINFDTRSGIKYLGHDNAGASYFMANRPNTGREYWRKAHNGAPMRFYSTAGLWEREQAQAVTERGLAASQ